MEAELEKRRQAQQDRLKTDPILADLTALFDGRVGTPSTKDELETITKEGKVRYEQRIPPGYEDEDKPPGNLYGDLVIWKQLLAKANEHKKGIIFITNERSPDWWDKHDDDFIGPRPELRREMKTVADSEFYMYSAADFLWNARKYLKQEVKDQTITEVEQVLEFKQEATYVLHAEPGNFEINPPQRSPRLRMLEEFGNLAKRINTWGSKVIGNKLSEDAAAQALATYLRELHGFANRWWDHMPDKVLKRLEDLTINCETLLPLPSELRNPKVEGFVRRTRDFYEILTQDWD
jgi:hypothetical protein